ncbi:MAG: GNAT family protein [Polyangiaceae bacterium]
MKIEACALVGAKVRLVPLGAEHEGAVIREALGSPEIWTHIPYAMRSEADVRARLAQAAALREAGAGMVYVTELLASAEIVGGTSILVVDPRVPSFEIGATWIVPQHQRTFVNSEAKYLQLCFAFETLKAARVELKTDVRNERSQAAIARIGARREGVLRSHMRREDGTLRDSVLFSLVDADWPQAKHALEAKLAR